MRGAGLNSPERGLDEGARERRAASAPMQRPIVEIVRSQKIKTPKVASEGHMKRAFGSKKTPATATLAAMRKLSSTIRRMGSNNGKPSRYGR
jgi:hypothetical protein